MGSSATTTRRPRPSSSTLSAKTAALPCWASPAASFMSCLASTRSTRRAAWREPRRPPSSQTPPAPPPAHHLLSPPAPHHLLSPRPPSSQCEGLCDLCARGCRMCRTFTLRATRRGPERSLLRPGGYAFRTCSYHFRHLGYMRSKYWRHNRGTSALYQPAPSIRTMVRLIYSIYDF